MTSSFISLEALDGLMRKAQETKKEFLHSKVGGKWFWSNRDEPFVPDEMRPFDTFFDCLVDAVGPYIFEDEDPEDV